MLTRRKIGVNNFQGGFPGFQKLLYELVLELGERRVSDGFRYLCKCAEAKLIFLVPTFEKWATATNSFLGWFIMQNTYFLEADKT